MLHRQLDDEMLNARRAITLFWRATRLRCPNCGTHGIFASWFKLRRQCPNCGLRLDRGEPDYFIGAYLINLVAIELAIGALVAVVVVATYPRTPWVALEWAAIVLSLVGAVVCYPISQVLWLAADLWLRPLTPQELDWHRRGAESAEKDLPQL